MHKRTKYKCYVLGSPTQNTFIEILKEHDCSVSWGALLLSDSYVYNSFENKLTFKK